ncbi:MAG: DUF1848 domain-containing protein [Alphaproteobacteria bacterium]
MIISASYKTDIPAFYGRWFMARLRAGHCRMTNPYGGQRYKVGLGADDVDGFVFWTKNLGPFLGHLGEIRDRGFPFMVQYSINNYPRAVEVSVVEQSRARDHLGLLAASFGPRVAVWRYDPIIETSLMPLDWHEENFAALAGSLRGLTDEVVVSFAHIYRKTRRNLDGAARDAGFDWRDPAPDEKRQLLARLKTIAARNHMTLSLCAQPDYLVAGVSPAKCIDAGRLEDIAGRPIMAAVKGNREGCQCFAARDIGAYDTCPQGCVYCYAVSDRARARDRLEAHDPEGEYLFPPKDADMKKGAADETRRRLAPVT